jgi:hypothetical protein
VLLIAANVGAARDHLQADRIENLGKQNEQLTEQNEQLVQRLLTMEQMLEQHVIESLKTHAQELQNQGALLRAVHAAVCPDPPADGGNPAARPTGEAQPRPGAPPRGRSRDRGGSGGKGAAAQAR